MTTNPNIIRLLEMLDHPEAYSEEEIRAIIDSDDETREAYRLMVAAKQGYTHRKNQQPADVQAAWRRLSCSHAHIISFPKFQKIAAVLIGILFVSGLVFAAIHIVRQQTVAQKTELPENAASTADTTPADTIANDTATAHPVICDNLPSETMKPETAAHYEATDTPATDTVTMPPVVFDNIPLEKMLPEIAAHYGATVSFANDEARQLRFRFVWNPQQGIGQVVCDLSQFERLRITIKDSQITVE